MATTPRRPSRRGQGRGRRRASARPDSRALRARAAADPRARELRASIDEAVKKAMETRRQILREITRRLSEAGAGTTRGIKSRRGAVAAKSVRRAHRSNTGRKGK